jgi:acetolactate synthase-1/2/3 large subunit
MAEAFGVRGIKCEHKCDVDKTVKEMLTHDGPCVVDFRVEPNEHVYPMVPAGKGLHEIVLGVVDQEGGKVEDRLRELMEGQQDLGSLA